MSVGRQLKREQLQLPVPASFTRFVAVTARVPSKTDIAVQFLPAPAMQCSLCGAFSEQGREASLNLLWSGRRRPGTNSSTAIRCATKGLLRQGNRVNEIGDNRPKC